LTNERLLDEVVRESAELMLPGEMRAADIAAQVAGERYAHWATFAEAHREARTFLESWAHHPSRAATRGPLSLAS
jgi:hypothetical protein